MTNRSKNCENSGSIAIDPMVVKSYFLRGWVLTFLKLHGRKLNSSKYIPYQCGLNHLAGKKMWIICFNSNLIYGITPKYFKFQFFFVLQGDYNYQPIFRRFLSDGN